jgi:hypothetical protein
LLLPFIFFVVNGNPLDNKIIYDYSKDFIQKKYQIPKQRLKEIDIDYMFGKGSHSIVLEEVNTHKRYYIELKLKGNKEVLWIEDFTDEVENN